VISLLVRKLRLLRKHTNKQHKLVKHLTAGIQETNPNRMSQAELLYHIRWAIQDNQEVRDLLLELRQEVEHRQEMET
jgi:hypothetical protein